MYICICIYLYMCIHLYVYTHMCTCPSLYSVYIYIYTHLQMHKIDTFVLQSSVVKNNTTIAKYENTISYIANKAAAKYSQAGS